MATFRAPTAEEIEHILQPQRPRRLREMASNIRTSGRDEKTVWLRTPSDENGETDQKFQEWIVEDENSDPNHMPNQLVKCVLNDASKFNFGDDWYRVFDIFPELAGHFSTNDLRRTMPCLYTGDEDGEDVATQRAEIK